VVTVGRGRDDAVEVDDGGGFGQADEGVEGAAVVKGDHDDARPVVAQVGALLRTLRASRGASQRELARTAGLSKSVVARLESGAPGEAVEGWLRALTALGLEVAVTISDPDDDLIAPPLHRDAAGRLFPAHSFAVRPIMAPTWWYVRHGGWLPNTTVPEWFWYLPAEWEFQERSAASTTSLASAWTCARCSGPRNDSA
jgi:transcriptional regulator with XRE-family HTH domain